MRVNIMDGSNFLSMSRHFRNLITDIYGNIELLFSSACLAKLSKEEQKMIDEAQKAKWDEYAINKAALDRGQNMARHEMAKDLLIEGDSVEKVVRISKLSEADVLAIKAEIDQK